MRRWRWPVTILLVVLVLPVPWLHHAESRLGLAWRLDERLVVEGTQVDPPGRWSWLTVGRPVLVGELLWDRLGRDAGSGADPVARDVRHGSVSSRPVNVDRVAAAVGLREAGRDVTLAIEVVVSGATQPELPPAARLTHLNGTALADRAALREALADSRRTGRLSFTTAKGDHHAVDGHALPFRRIEVVDVAPQVEAAIGGQGAPYDWIRSMSMGSSHGLMVGLVTFVSVSGEDLARGRHVAGTGRLLGDGTVHAIGGLEAKASGARRADVDVLLVPATQLAQLDGFDAGDMQVVGVRTLSDAIEALRAPTAGLAGQDGQPRHSAVSSMSSGYVPEWSQSK